MVEGEKYKFALSRRTKFNTPAFGWMIDKGSAHQATKTLMPHSVAEGLARTNNQQHG